MRLALLFPLLLLLAACRLAPAEFTQPTPAQLSTAQTIPSLPGGTPATALFVWQSASPCAFLIIGEETATFGECDAPPQPLPEPMASEMRQRITAWRQTYASIENETAAGKITLQGSGNTSAPPEIARQMAEWAQAQWKIAVSGRAGAAWDLVFTFARYGGIAGFCDELNVYTDGNVAIRDCKGREAHFDLSAEQLQQMYRWLDTFAPFEFRYADPPNVADGMTITWTFHGRGTQAVDAATQEQMQEFLGSLLSTLYRL